MNLLKYEYVMLYNKVIRAIRSRMDVGPLQLRTYLEKLSRFAPIPSGVRITSREIGGIMCQVVSYKGSENPDLILYLHGGAFAFGSPQTHRSITGYLAKVTGRTIYVPDYRLAPEHKYPAALNDCETAYAAIRDEFPDAKVAVIGDSAGGNLTAALTERCLAKNLPLPEKIALLSAWLDLAPDSKSATLNLDEDSVFDKDDLQAYAKLYIDQDEYLLPDASPLRSSNLNRFPPTLIQVAKNELLFPDSDEFAKKLEAANVPLQYEVSEKLFHSWQVFPNYVKEGKTSIESIAQFVQSENEVAATN